jgi:hypothetical protein
MLEGFDVSAVVTVEELKQSLRSAKPSDTPLDCIILDHQAEATADGVVRLLESLDSPTLKDTKLIHLYTPVTDTISSNPVFANNTSGILRMTKPPRKARLLQALAKLRRLPPETYAHLRSTTALTAEEPPECQRTLFGNVLIAEGECAKDCRFGDIFTEGCADNPVAQKLLVKQLQRYDLNVIATSNGEEAIAGNYFVVQIPTGFTISFLEWERYEPGYFSLAIFDHRMLSPLAIPH